MGRETLAKARWHEVDLATRPKGHRLKVQIAQQMKAQEKRIGLEFGSEAIHRQLMSVPGIGPTLAAVIACEVDSIERFSSAEKLCAYAGVVPTTHSSGGKTRHGQLLPFCNKWLRWALIEASWVAIGCSPYFGALYKQHRARGKKANSAVLIVARRMCRIIWQLLHEKRDFEKRPLRPNFNFPGCSVVRLTAATAARP